MTHYRNDPANPLPDYHHLLLDAAAASEAVDRFDLHSDDPESAATFGVLKAQALAATVALLDYCKANDDAIRRWLAE